MVSSPDSFFANSPMLDVIRSNAALGPTWLRTFRALNSEPQSDPSNMTTQKETNASRAMNETLPATTKDRFSAFPRLKRLFSVSAECFCRRGHPVQVFILNVVMIGRFRPYVLGQISQGHVDGAAPRPIRFCILNRHHRQRRIDRDAEWREGLC
jgi:hypothetical protein